jgi:hypothetical protein
MKNVSKTKQKFINIVTGALVQLLDGRPEQTIQEQWDMFLNEGPFTYEKYLQFMKWRSHHMDQYSDN